MLNKTKLFFSITILISLTDMYAQNIVKDTLFIKYNKALIEKNTHPQEQYAYYYFIEDINSGDAFFFKEKSINKIIKVGKYMDLERLLQSETILKSVKGKKVLDDWELWLYFREKTIFLIKDNSIIELEANYVIE